MAKENYDACVTTGKANFERSAYKIRLKIFASVLCKG